MQHRDLYPHEILQDVIEKSYAKSEGRLKTLAILSFLGGGYVSFGYMAYLKVVSGIPPEWSGLATLLGAAVFPICLICILIGGGELATGNMMMMALGRLTRRVSFKKLFRNWIVVSLLCRAFRRCSCRKNYRHCRSQSANGFWSSLSFRHRL